ncbi:hypothetical protein ACWEIJ_28255 [Lentzea sp. NPDC004789]
MSSALPSYVDTSFDDDELMQAALALVSGDLGPALGFLAATRDQPYRRELAVDVLGAAGNVVLPALLDAEEERPDDVNLLLLLGSAQSTAGWQERGAAWAKDTSEDQFRGLVNFTRRARATLRRAASLDPDDVAPWAALLGVALGAPTHRGEAAEVYEEVVKRKPDLVTANLRRLQSVAAKWYGSHEEMFAFARAGIAGLPDGHPLLALIPIAHIERYLNKLSSGNIIPRVWQLLTSSYLKKQRKETDAASDRLLAGAGGHPHSLYAHQIFAMYYYEANANDRLALHIARSGPRAATWPWGYFGDHNERFRLARERAATA